MMQSGDWTPEHSQALRDYVAHGISFARATAEINARFGTSYTRNAALGRAKRMGLMLPARKDHRPMPVRTARVRKRKAVVRGAAKSRERLEGGPTPVAGAAAPPVQLRCIGTSPRLISLVELEPGDCRYPYGGDKDGEPISFCGHPRRVGSSYCTPHFHLTRGLDRTADRSPGPVALRLVQAA